MVDAIFSNFGEDAIADGVLDWRIVSKDGNPLASDRMDVGRLPLGPARMISTFGVVFPKTEKPVTAVFSMTVRDRVGSIACSNGWPIWIFPQGPSLEEIMSAAAKSGVVIAKGGSAVAKTAQEEGRNLISVNGTDGKPNVSLGWWWMGTQVGTAIKPHPVLGDFPYESVMTPLWFRLIKDKGLQLPASGITPDEMIIVGEGETTCFLYLAERVRGTSRVLECHGIDLMSGTPEGNSLLLNLVRHLRNKNTDKQRKDE